MRDNTAACWRTTKKETPREYDEGPSSSDDRRRHAPHAGEHHRGEHHPKCNRGWLESMGDIFD
jgi:hypothetical protein